MTSAYAKSAAADGDFVEAFLRDNPGWLADRPELYRVLAPPIRVHGERLADHKIEVRKLERIQPSMEDVFVALIEAEERKAA